MLYLFAGKHIPEDRFFVDGCPGTQPQSNYGPAQQTDKFGLYSNGGKGSRYFDLIHFHDAMAINDDYRDRIRNTNAIVDHHADIIDLKGFSHTTRRRKPSGE